VKGTNPTTTGPATSATVSLISDTGKVARSRSPQRLGASGLNTQPCGSGTCGWNGGNLVRPGRFRHFLPGKGSGTSVFKERLVTLILPPEPASAASARAYVDEALDTVGIGPVTRESASGWRLRARPCGSSCIGD